MLSDPDGFARLVLLRHPELADADRARAVGQGDAELSRRGRTHTLEVLRALAGIKIDAVYSSPASQCVDGARAIASDRGFEVRQDERLHDQALGDWQGQDWASLQQEHAALLREFFQDYGLVAPPEGEALGDAVDRALGWWNDVVDGLENKCAVVVAASPLLSGLAARLLGLSLRRAAALNLPASGFGILDVFRDGAALRSWHPLALRDELP